VSGERRAESGERRSGKSRVHGIVRYETRRCTWNANAKANAGYDGSEIKKVRNKSDQRSN
jgi:hypothetical protein